VGRHVFVRGGTLVLGNFPSDTLMLNQVNQATHIPTRTRIKHVLEGKFLESSLPNNNKGSNTPNCSDFAKWVRGRGSNRVEVQLEKPRSQFGNAKDMMGNTIKSNMGRSKSEMGTPKS
jgi:hypothetical protein